MSEVPASPATPSPTTLAELQALAGREIGTGPWIEITQAMVDKYLAGR